MRDTTDATDAFLARLRAAPAEFGAMPFWFWNDDLDEAELLRQLRALAAGGCGGVTVHPRIGLSPRIGYLTAEYFRLLRLVVEECARLGLRVILYDEGSYPSGSACGQVVAADPGHAARALILTQRSLTGPWRGPWRVADGRSLLARPVCAVLARVETASGTIDPASATLLEVEPGGLVRLEVGPGEWKALACLDVPSGGTIRGVLPEHEDGMATAPPAGDIMNPAAVASFIRLTHERYAAALGAHLGTTVVAMFTDEPSPLGRHARGGAFPFTAGFDAWLAGRLGRSLEETWRWLPALWEDYGPQTEAFRRACVAAVEARIDAVFYAAQADWCAAHGLALTGHPHSSNDMASLVRFHWPGQDAVWRWVAPGDGTGLEGEHSVSAKAATSAARAAGRRRVATELFGAYGWRLSLDEAKWLTDWHLARGNNLFVPHACFYSVRGGRAFESEPDVALHNPWWVHFQDLLGYTRRMSWLLTDGEQVCAVAVAGVGHHLGWEAARRLYEAQIDFLYVDAAGLAAAALDADGRLCVGAQRYRAVVLEPDFVPTPEGAARVRAFAAAGGAVLRAPLEAPDVARLRALSGPDVTIDPPASGLRVQHVRRDGLDVYALFNEGESPIEGQLTVAAPGRRRLIDPLRPDAPPAGADSPAAAGRVVALSLPRRESRLLLVDPGGAPGGATGPAGGPGPGEAGAGGVRLTLSGPWEVSYEDGTAAPQSGLGDWTAVRELERWAGRLRYRTTVDGGAGGAHPALTLALAPAVDLDLGAVGEAAAVSVNGVPAGAAMWAPYVLPTAGLWRPGPNRLDVWVTPSAANGYEGAGRPAGLLGPVTLRLRPAGRPPA